MQRFNSSCNNKKSPKTWEQGITTRQRLTASAGWPLNTNWAVVGRLARIAQVHIE
jgi:lipopolysaccharide assembly outer membrane protein LptD (OstA)